MSPAKKRSMIQRDHPDLSISQQCKLVSLSRSAFYYTPVGVNADTLAMMKEIDRAFTRYPFFGSRQIAAYLRREGIVIGRHRARRLMAKMGLEAIYKRPRTSQPHFSLSLWAPAAKVRNPPLSYRKRPLTLPVMAFQSHCKVRRS